MKAAFGRAFPTKHTQQELASKQNGQKSTGLLGSTRTEQSIQATARTRQHKGRKMTTAQRTSASTVRTC